MLSRSLSRPLLRLRPFASSLLSSPSTSSQPDPTQRAPSPRPQRASLSGGTVWGSFLGQRSRPFSSSGKDAGDRGGSWKFTRDNADDAHDLFGKPDESAAAVAGLSDLGEHAGGADAGGGDPWRSETLAPEPKKGDIFLEIDEELQSKKGMHPDVRSEGGGEWETAQGYKPWGFEEDEGKGEAFQFGGEQGGLEGLGDGGEMQNAKVEQLEQLEKEEKELLTKLKGQTFLTSCL